MNHFNPTGLTRPDCVCWQKQAKQMERMLDLVAAEVCLITVDGAVRLNICDTAKDYYLASIVWAVMSIGIRQKKDDDGSCVIYQKEYEDMFERIKLLVLQRLDYIDGVVGR